LRALALKSGKTNGFSSKGTSLATGLRRRVITNSAPASTLLTSAARLCCASMIEHCFTTHNFNA
jgi:hypothetical protein